MERAIERLYRRLGPRYLSVLLAMVAVNAAIWVFMAGAALAAYVSATSALFLRTAALGLGGSLVAIAILYPSAFRRLQRPVLAWINGERTPELAAEAWRAITTQVFPMIVWGVVLISLFMIPAELYAFSKLDVSASTAAALVLGVEIGALGAALMDYFGFEILLQPILREVAANLPADFALPEARIRIRWKLLAAILLISVSSGAFVAAVQSPSLAPASRPVVGIGAALLFTLTVSMLLTRFLTRSVVGPVDALMRGTRSVQEGDLRVHIPPTSADEMGVLTASFNQMVRGVMEREALAAAMGSYVDPTITRRILEEGASLEGQEVDVTLMFIDIRGFTARSERLSAARTVSVLNDFLELVVPVITRHGGHANKFLGDGVLSVFGAPEPHPDHARRAVAAAQEIVGAVRDAHAADLRIGIGVNSGVVVAGTIGGGGRLEFGVIGDAVNVAARVEELTKETGDHILLTESTYASLGTGGSDGFVSRGPFRLRGRAEAVQIYAAPC